MQSNNVLQLERAIVQGTAEDVMDVIREGGPFDFTARAMGLCLRFGDPEKMLMLIKTGASLDYDTHSNVLRIYYNTIFSTSEIWGEDYPARYFLMPVFDRITERLIFFGTLYDESDDFLRVDGEEIAPAPESICAESVELLCKYNVINSASRDLLLYYAILFGRENIAEVLCRCGAKITRFDLADSFTRLINSYENIQLTDCDTLQRLLKLSSAQFTVDDATFNYLLRYEIWLTERWRDFRTLLICGNASPERISDTALKLIELDKSDALSEISERLPREKLDSFLDAAISAGRSKCTAFLLNLKHKG